LMVIPFSAAFAAGPDGLVTEYSLVIAGSARLRSARFFVRCGAVMTVRVQWPYLEPGVTPVWVEVDPVYLAPEADEQDNLTSAMIVFPRVLLSLLSITRGVS
jgi:hypothetical protein